jgi:hypothetical protein
MESYPNSRFLSYLPIFRTQVFSGQIASVPFLCISNSSSTTLTLVEIKAFSQNQFAVVSRDFIAPNRNKQ